MKEEKKEQPQSPSLDEIIKNNPPVKNDSEIEYEDDDEEEDLDITFPLEDFEGKYYDDEGKFHPDGYNKESK